MQSDIPDPEGWFELRNHARIHDGFLKLDTYKVVQRRFDGGFSPEVTREIMVARAAIAALLYDPLRDEVVMVEQLRLPAALAGFPPVSREAVAGLVEPGEGLADVVRREVFEETGLTVIGEPEMIVDMLVSPGNTTQRIYLYCAYVDTTSAGGHHGLADENEDIRVVVEEFPTFAAAIRKGRPDNAIALVAGYWLIENRPRLQARWNFGNK